MTQNDAFLVEQTNVPDTGTFTSIPLASGYILAFSAFRIELQYTSC